MSEAERRKRLNYKRNRKKWITALTALFTVFFLLSVALGALYFRAESTHEIPYYEKGGIDYTVRLLQNDFYDAEELGEGQSYVASIIDTIKADFSYVLRTDEEKMEYRYSYSIYATLEITDNDTKAIIFAPEYVIRENTEGYATGGELIITDSTEIDYRRYNGIAESFIKTYGLSSVTPRLTVTMKTDVTGSAEELGCDSNMSYTTSLTVPLTKRTVSVSLTETAPGSEAKVFICDESLASRSALGYSAVGGLSLSLILFIVLLFFIFLTRNHDINYSIKIRRILGAYKSYIQKLKGEFDTNGYQVLEIDTFPEMLGIRDTLQSPILMSENADETRTLFLIPTQTKLLYLFEIKVDNYDELYGVGKDSKEVTDNTPDCAELTVSAEYDAYEEATPEGTEGDSPEAAPDESIREESLPEESATAEADTGKIPRNEAAIPAVTEDAAVEVRYRTSFMSRLIQSEDTIKEKYSLIKNYLLSFSGVKARTSLNFESFKRGRISCAKLNVKGSYLLLYLALDPEKYSNEQYRVSYVGDKPKLDTVPMLFKIKGERSMKQAYLLIDECMNALGIKQSDIPNVDYRLPYESTEMLIERELIKVIAPTGVLLDANTPTEKADVEELLRDKRHKRSDAVLPDGDE
ncbi:MAG: hypothetical protein IJW48_00760 [Clostridia bacterium]|nr:hypothetical protein [Clostridia bacterium]